MAKKRMVSNQIVDSDDFLDMSLSGQALYLHLLVRADDEGFLNNVRKIMRMIGARDDDLKVLILKNFILTFPSGVIVIKHWLIHNVIRKDRIIPTVHTEEKEQLAIKENNSYSFKGPIQESFIISDGQMSGNCQATARIGLDKISIDKIRLEESNKEKSKKEKTLTSKTKYLDYVLLSKDEHEKLIDLMGFHNLDTYIENLNNYIGSKGKKYKSHYHTIRNWYNMDKSKPTQQKNDLLSRAERLEKKFGSDFK